MKAMVVQAEKEDRPLVWTEVETPACGPDEVLVDVYATALNRADLMQRAGKYPPPPGESEI
ncbi:MAG TPA: NAD(P)H-quinone oxidoreductase, partial [Anaerolineae bacterium]|nr:NAD(P)H-quinone oxidoreductase [Anaerolineae bacterium]